MAAQHAGGKRPGHLQLFHIRGVDLAELGIAGIGVIAGLHHPLLGIVGRLFQRLVGADRKTLQGHQAKHRRGCDQ
jgi:hypothetical protein